VKLELMLTMFVTPSFPTPRSPTRARAHAPPATSHFISSSGVSTNLTAIFDAVRADSPAIRDAVKLLVVFK